MIRSITSDDREYSLPRNIFGKLKDDIHKRINVPHNAMLDSRNAKNFLTFLGKMRNYHECYKGAHSQATKIFKALQTSKEQ